METHRTLPVHPVAALFPMLPDDELAELAELAEDIKRNGLLHPIVLDAEGTLIDGRNRLAACDLAGVEPRFVRLNGQDPVAYILSTNIARRHLNAGQRAMAVARVRLVSKQTTREAAQVASTSASRVAQAAMVLEHVPELADSVLTGTMPLDQAYAEAKKRKDVIKAREAEAERAAEDLAKLRVNAPDLADRVAEECITLREALDRRRG